MSPGKIALVLSRDSEYRWAGAEDPHVVVTTSRDPSSRLKQFAKVCCVTLVHTALCYTLVFLPCPILFQFVLCFPASSLPLSMFILPLFCV